MSTTMLEYAATNCFGQATAFWNVMMTMHNNGECDVSPIPMVQYSKWNVFSKEWPTIHSYTHPVLDSTSLHTRSLMVIKFDLHDANQISGHSWVIFQLRQWNYYVVAQAFQGRFDLRYTHCLTSDDMSNLVDLMGKHLLASNTLSICDRATLSNLVLPNWNPEWPTHKLFDESKSKQTVEITVAFPQVNLKR